MKKERDKEDFPDPLLLITQNELLSEPRILDGAYPASSQTQLHEQRTCPDSVTIPRKARRSTLGTGTREPWIAPKAEYIYIYPREVRERKWRRLLLLAPPISCLQ